MLCGIGIQAAKGYFRFEPALYFSEMFGIELLNYWMICALALAVHSIVNHKYIGHFVMIVYYVLLLFAGQLGLEHNLYKFGNVPGAVYSDINGYGHFMLRLRSFQAYWGAGSLLLLIAAYLMWARGTLSGWRERWAQARARVNGPTVGVALLAFAAFAGVGGYIFYNTNVLNIYESTYDAQRHQVDYEKTYKHFADEPQPKITAVNLTVDLYPAEQRVRMRGAYAIANKNSVPIDVLHLNFAAGRALVIMQLTLGVPSQLAEDNPTLGVRGYKLTAPLPPGESTTLAFDLELP